MKKKLVSYLVLACSIFGLAMVGSCKDYEFDVLQDEIDYVQGQIPKNLAKNLQEMKDSIDSMRVRLAAVVSCTCSGTGGAGCTCTPCTVNCDSVRKELDTLYNFIGEVLNDTIGKYVTGYTGDDKSLSAVLNDIYIHLSNAAAQADMAAKADTGDLKRKADTTLVNGKADTALVNQKADTATVNPVLRELAQGLSDMRQLWSDSFKLVWDTALRAYKMAVANEKAIKAAQDSANKALQLIYALNGLDHHSHSKEFFDSIDTTFIKADTCLNRIARMANEIENLKELAQVYLDSAKNWADTLAKHVRIELTDSMEKVRKEYQAADAKINKALLDSMSNHRQRIGALEQARKKIEQDIIDINNTLDDIKDRLDAVEDEVADLSSAESKRITSLYAQSTVNPIFGSFALPIGIKSNILATYYGKVVVSGSYKFPATVSDAMSGAFFGLDMDVPLTSAESAVVGANQLSLANNQNLIIESEGNAGTIYLTVNPNEVVIDDTYSFSFVNSNNETTNATIGALQDASNDEPLAFGWTKAASSNGFYKAPVTVAADKAASLAPTIGVTKEELAEIAKDIYHFKDVEPGNVLGDIAGALLDLVRGTKLVASAVKVEWYDGFGNHTVTSNYDLAVTAIKPLSYNNFNREFKKFPKIPAITTSTSMKGRSYISIPVTGSKKIMNKMNSILKKINALTNKINKKLDDGLSLNAFVQPVIFYAGDDNGLDLMSNDASKASSFKLPSSGEGEIELLLTSFTAELLTPAYKTYIAVVDYVDPAGNQNTTIAQNVNEANADFNTVLDGDQIIATFATGTPGTYTIYYSTVDYSGVIAAGRFYVTVKQ